MNPDGLVTLSGWRYPPLIVWDTWLWFAESVFVVYVLMLLITFGGELRSGRRDSQVVAVFVLSAIGVAALLNVRLLAMSPPMRLRFSARGHELRRGPGALKLRPWHAAYSAKLRALGKGYWQISIGWKDPIRSGSNALQLCWRCDAASSERLRQTIDGFYSAAQS